MQLLTEGVYRLERATGANAYLIDTGTSSVVVDTGTRGGAVGLAAELSEQRGVSPISGIVLTHYDPDHVGTAAALQRQTGARVWIGERDARILRGEDAPPTRFRRFLARVSPRSEVPADLQELSATEETEVAPGVVAIPAPGHTPGHIIVVWRGIVFAGDSVRVSNGRLVQMPRVLTSDRGQAEETERLIAARSPRLVCPGHGKPGRLTV